jgi:hypothetical protein
MTGSERKTVHTVIKTGVGFLFQSLPCFSGFPWSFLIAASPGSFLESSLGLPL